jgi:hypothetical protein
MWFLTRSRKIKNKIHQPGTPISLRGKSKYDMENAI